MSTSITRSSIGCKENNEPRYPHRYPHSIPHTPPSTLPATSAPAEAGGGIGLDAVLVLLRAAAGLDAEYAADSKSRPGVGSDA